jgi:asparagine synthase (glutamine-hydrolysing)
MLSDERLRGQGLFNPMFVNKLIGEHESGSFDHAKTLWTLLVFQLWLENFGASETQSLRPIGSVDLKTLQAV